MAVDNATIVSFIELLGRLALAECNRRAKAGAGFIVPSVCIAQSAHETGWGTSPIMSKANAFFGIKAGSNWTGKTISADTWEVYDGVVTNITAQFRAYDSLEDSVADYYNLTVNNARYAKAVSYYPDKMKSAYDTLYNLWSGGYATDNNYVEHVMNLLNGRDLDQFDSQVNPANATGDFTYEGGSSGGSGGSDAPSTPSDGTGKPVTFVFTRIK